MQPYINSSCNKCGRPLYESDEVILCPSCRRPHHVSCWIGLGGCATAGCPEQSAEMRTSAMKQQIQYAAPPAAPYAAPPAQPPYGTPAQASRYDAAQAPTVSSYAVPPVPPAVPSAALQTPPAKRSKNKKRLIALILILVLGSALLLFLNRGIFITSVSISPPEEVVILPEGEVKLTAVVTPGFANQGNLEWSSSNQEVAGVDKNGNVKGFQDGTCEITVRSKNGHSASCSVMVCSLAREWVYAGLMFEGEIISATSGKGRLIDAVFSMEGTKVHFETSIRSDDPTTITMDGTVTLSKNDEGNVVYMLNPDDTSTARTPLALLKDGYLAVALHEDLIIIFTPIGGTSSPTAQQLSVHP